VGQRFMSRIFDYEIRTGISLSCGEQVKRKKFLLIHYIELELKPYNMNRVLSEGTSP
jgi:hypothetical protein